MTASRRAWLTALVAAGGALVALGLAALLQWSSLDEPTRDALVAAARDQAILLVLLVVLLAVGAGLFAARLVRSYEVPLRRLAADVAAGFPKPGVESDVPAGVRRVASAVRGLASRHAEIQDDLDDRVSRARAALESEHARLAALVSELAVPLLLCTADGQILLYNDAAHDLLDDGAGAVGLGRSVFGVIDRDLVAHALERVPALGGRASAVAQSRGGRMLRVRVAPVRRAAPVEPPSRESRPRESPPPGLEPYEGFVLTLEDMTTRAELSARRDAELRSLTEGIRAAAGAIRAAIEAVLDYPDMAPAEQRRFAELIRDEADRLGELLQQVAGDAESDLVDRWLLEDVPAAVLLEAVARQAGATTDEPASPALEGVWLRVDTFALAQAVARLAEHVRDDLGGTALRVALAPDDRFGALDLLWTGPPLTTVDLRAWEAAGSAPGPFAVVARHGGEVWPGTADGTPYVRQLLPRASGEPETTGTRRALREITPRVASRPQFYDFGLLEATPLPPGWEDRRLDAVAYTVLDTETTGLDPSADRVVSVGAVRVVRGRVLHGEIFERLVNPGRSIPRTAVAVHGITDRMVADQPGLEPVLSDLGRFASDTVLVGHDVSFDLAFLQDAGPGDRWPQTPVLDTLLLSAVVDPDAKAHSLDTLAERFGLDLLGRHTSVGDALMTAEVFLRLLPLLDAHGISTVGEAVAASRRTPQSRRSVSMYGRR